jgi:hypothetical protein
MPIFVTIQLPLNRTRRAKVQVTRQVGQDLIPKGKAARLAVDRYIILAA